MKTLYLAATFAVLFALHLTTTQASTVTPGDAISGGIGYRWTVGLGGIDSATFSRHVGAWSWEDDSLTLPGPIPVGWQHQSDWVALTLAASATVTVHLQRDAFVSQPIAGDPGHLAETDSMYPSFTIFGGLDNDLAPQAFADAENGGDPTHDWHWYNNDRNVVWAEDLSYLGHVSNSTDTSSEATFALPAGSYSIAIGSNAASGNPARQGYRATLTSVPEPGSALLLAAGLGLLGLRRRRVSAGGKNLALVAAAVLLLPLGAEAHITYSGRNFGVFAGGEAPVTILNQAVSGAFGWADGTDADFGDAHRLRAFRFTLTANTTVTIGVQATAFGANIAGVLPGFSIFSGLVHLSPAQNDHDTAPVSLAWLASLPGPAKEGVFSALTDWKVGNDDGVTFADLSSLTYMGHAVDGTAANYGSAPGIVGDGLADSAVTGTFNLPAGDYSFIVGGADYASGIGAVAPFQGYGINTTLTAAPEPTTGLMLLLGLGTLALRRQRTPLA